MTLKIKLTQYARELRFAWFVGSNLFNKMRLANATICFHLSNAIGAKWQSTPKRYRVNLVSHAQDLWLRTVGGDFFVLHEIFGSRCYEPPPIASELRTIVDLGANVGLATLYLSTRAPSARFICVEPVPTNAELLRRNVASLPSAIVVQAAIAKESGSIMFDNMRPAWGGAISREGKLRVDSVSMDELLARYVPTGPIDLLKIDIEGAEAEILSGPMHWLDRVSCIIAELHSPFSLREFKQVMLRRGFEILESAIMPTAVRRVT